MIYKPNSCSPFIDVSDIKDVPFFLKCQIDSSNSRVDGYSIRILDSENNQVFPKTDDSATRRAVDINEISLTDDLFQITKTKSGSFANVDIGSYKNLNTGLNGSVLMIPFIVSTYDSTVSIKRNQLILNDINANFPTLFNGGDYKWIITLYQLQYKNGQWIIPTDTKYYDIILTTGVVLGSCPKRIHSFHNKNLQKDYWMELLHLYSFNADNGYENWSYNSNYPITSDNIVGHRVRINNFDQSFGYIYPVEGEDGILQTWLNHPDNTDAQNAAAANAFRVYELGDGNGDGNDLPETRKVEYLYDKDYFGVEYLPESADAIEWNDQMSNPSNSYFSITYKTQYHPTRDGFYPLNINPAMIQLKTQSADHITYNGYTWEVKNGSISNFLFTFNNQMEELRYDDPDWFRVVNDSYLTSASGEFKYGIGDTFLTYNSHSVITFAGYANGPYDNSWFIEDYDVFGEFTRVKLSLNANDLHYPSEGPVLMVIDVTDSWSGSTVHNSFWIYKDGTKSSVYSKPGIIGFRTLLLDRAGIPYRYYFNGPENEWLACIDGKTRVAFCNNTCPRLVGDEVPYTKYGHSYVGYDRSSAHEICDIASNQTFNIYIEASSTPVNDNLKSNYFRISNGKLLSVVDITSGYYTIEIANSTNQSKIYYYCYFYNHKPIAIHKDEYDVWDATLEDVKVKYRTLTDTKATSFNGIFIPIIDKTAETPVDSDGFYTVKVRWMRAPDADTLGEIKDKTIYAVDRKRNYTFILWDKDTIRIDKTPAPQDYEDCKLNQPRGLIGIIDERPIAFVDSESDDVYKHYIAPIFYNIPCETNKEGIMFLRPFNGLEPGMLWQELDPTKTKDQLRHYLIDTLNTEYWYTKYRPMYLGTDNSNPKYSSTVIPDVTKYQIKSHFKTSDENPFSFRDEPTIDIKVYPLEGSNSGTAYTEIDGVIEIDGSRNIHCEGENYNQAQNINWKSFQWILYDENGNVIDVTDPQYSGKIEYDFYGLVGGKEYTLELIIETYEGYIIKSTKTLKTTFKEETGLKYPLKIELDCDLHAAKIYLTMNGGVVASANHSASAVERDGYLDLRDSITYDSMVYPDTDFSTSLSTKPETDSILIESEHIIKSDNYDGRVISIEGKTETGDPVVFEASLSNIETTGDEEVRVGDGFRLIYNYKGGNG